MLMPHPDKLLRQTSNKLSPAQFTEHAFIYHLCIINWPASVCFPSHSLNLKQFTPTELYDIAQPHLDQIDRYIMEEKGEAFEDIGEQEKCFEMVLWDEGSFTFKANSIDY